MAEGDVSILEGSTFVVSDRRGDMDATPNQPRGLFDTDTRFLSTWLLTMNGVSPQILSTEDLQYFSSQFFLVPPTTVTDDASLSLIRKRAVGGGFHEDLTLYNHGATAQDVELKMEAASDFADLFEVKDPQTKRGEYYQRIEEGRLVLGYRRDTWSRETWIAPTAAESSVDHGGISFRIHLEPHGEWTTCIDVITVLDPDEPGERAVKYGHGDDHARPNMSVSLEEWIAQAPTVSSSWNELERISQRSIVDLAALRYFPPILPGKAVPAAGLPWFMTLFGRDSLTTSYMAMPFEPELAESTLLLLAARQGETIDEFRDEEPGKILHEQRLGELTAFEERPHSPYFGSADATQLWLIVLDELHRWSGNDEFVRALEPAARDAIRWIDEYGDRDGDGYVEYGTRNPETGLENQCWKDSAEAIVFGDGSMSKLPRATCELQGYVYDAKLRTARLARDVWGDHSWADQLEKEATELKAAFNEDFWVADREFFALALDGDKRKVDSITSNMGHLLWSGIVDDDKAPAVVKHLMGDQMFSGWGVRTMAEGEGGYSPVRYHCGTVWPHDNAIIAMGLMRYGYRDEASRIARSILEAATYFRYRLPETFAGYARGLTDFPVEYPTACSPQAWAAGAPLLFIRVMLGLEPDGDRLASAPVLPEGVSRLEVTGIPGRWGTADVAGGEQASAQPPTTTPPSPGQGDESPASGDGEADEARRLIAGIPDRIDPRWFHLAEGTYGLEVTGLGSWRLTVRDGKASLSEGAGDADLTVSMSLTDYLHVARGEQNAQTALLQRRIRARGDMSYLARLTRILRPPPPAA